MDIKGFEEFCKLNKIDYKLSEPMKFHTSFKIGGCADIFVSVLNVEQLQKVICFLKESGIPYFVLGKGSNLLVSDKGIEGAVISLLKMSQITVNGNCITAQSGASLASLCNVALENSLTGLEFAFGIPGTVGGALYMNAGAYGGEMADVVESCKFLDSDAEIKEFSLKDMELGYRTSIFKNGEKIILSVTFNMKKGQKAEIKGKMDDFLSRRKEKQPLEYPSAGSTFKRPEGYFAGALIEKNALKGVTVGGAQVSEKHAGFIINKNNASANDVLTLIEKIKEVVKTADGVELCPEVIFVGKK